MRNFIRNYLDDFLLLAGCGSILYGLSIWNPVITWIVAGIMLIGLGVMIGISEGQK